jgi:signal transduction histidine kinase
VPDQEKKGAGLGLTIAREIVVAHGGSIACSSKVGEGSDFYFLLPAR